MTASTPRTAAAAAEVEFEAASRFDARYAVGELLGAGGMGEVHACRDRVIDRDVAVKRMRTLDADHPELLTRFVQEARLQAQLEHPSIVPVYDLGASADGAVYFTMKRIDGATLREVLDGLIAGDEALRARYSTNVLLGAFSRVCFAIAYAHDRGVVHRDLKPENVILGDFDEVYVLDWGVAKLLNDTEAHGERQREHVRDSLPDVPTAETGAHALLGTLGYMAPEQLTRGSRIDARADVYALGVVLYELLTLERLHRGSAPEAAASTVEGVSIESRPEISDALAAVIARATQVDPGRRLGSARELRDAIESYLDVDRDAERKRTLAREHVLSAERALDEPQDGGEDRRLTALRELNAALVLDPTNGGALVRLLRLLAELPSKLPAAVEAELASARMTERAKSSRRTALTYVAIGMVMVGIVLTGTRAPLALCVIAALSAVTAAHSWIAAAQRTRTLHFVISLVLKTAVTASLCVLFGPLVLVPSVLIAVALVVVVHQRASPPLRRVVVGVSLAAFIVPWLLATLGLLPRSYAIAEGSLAILPWGVALTPGVALGVLAVATTMSLLIPVVLVGSSIDALTRAEERFFAQAWYLKGLIAGEPPATPAFMGQRGEPKQTVDREAPTIADDGDNAALGSTVIAERRLAQALAETIPSGVQSLPGPRDGDPPSATHAAALGLSVSGSRYDDTGAETADDDLRRCRDRIIGREVFVQHGPRSACDELIARARVQGRLQHPGVLPVYDVGADQSGEPFFTVRHPRGRTLDSVLKAPESERPSLRTLLTLFGRACMTVAYAHTQRVVHHRLDVTQILIGEYDDVYVLGFSLGKELVDAREAHADVAALGEILGRIVGQRDLPELKQVCRRARDGQVDPRTLHEEVQRYLEGQRDRERRAQLADAHVERALGALDAPDHDRANAVTALHEINAALALDPANPGALRALVRVLDDAPKRLPPAVTQQAHEARAHERARAARRATWGYVAILVSVLVMLGTIARDPVALAAIALAAAAAAAHTYWVGPARGRVGQAILSVTLAISVVALLGSLLGPLLLAPVVALAMVSTQLVHARAPNKTRILVASGYLAALFIPLVLGLLGVFEPVYSFADGVMFVRPVAVAFDEVSTPLLLAAATALSLLVPAALVGRSIDALGSAERRQAAQASLLRRLLPGDQPRA